MALVSHSPANICRVSMSAMWRRVLASRRVRGKGGVEAAVPLPEVAQRILAEYIATDRGQANRH